MTLLRLIIMLTKLKNERWHAVSNDEWRSNECSHVSSLGRVFSEKHQQKKRRFKLSVVNGYDRF